MYFKHMNEEGEELRDLRREERESSGVSEHNLFYNFFFRGEK